MTSKNFEMNPKLDLVLERVVDVPAKLLWKGWTEPEHIKKWFCPKPWQVTECGVDLRPGGAFRFVMQGPEGQVFPNLGCFLEIVENKKLIWTSALHPGYRPALTPKSGVDFFFTAYILLEPQGQGTKYTAMVRHADEDSCKQHAEMGFQEGWGICLDQLVECIHKGDIS